MIAGLKPYPKMRDSGVAWLGDVPVGWGVKRAKAVFDLVDVRSKTGDEELLTVSSKNGVVRRSSQSVTMFKAESYVGHKLCWPGDLVVNSLWAWGRGLGFAREHGLVSSAYSVYRPKAPFAGYADYLNALVRSDAYHWELMTRSKGVWISRLQLSDASFFDMPMVLPPEGEVAAIVRFLDHADRRIRRSMAAKQKMIRLLEEQKAAIVYQAVTRGLNPDAPMRPSGVDWIGDIPAHWDVVQARRLAKPGRRITYGIVQPGEPDPLGRFMVRGQDYSFGWGEPNTLFRVSDAIEAPYQRSRLLAGDLVYTIVGAGVGNVAEVPPWLDGANITQTSARISIDLAKAEPSFVRFSLESPIGRRAVDYYVKGAAQPGLNLEHLRVFPIPLPPLEEQRDILRYLEAAGTEVGPAVRAAKREIELLGEYRARLVADVVTGKLDVREVAADLQNLEPTTLDLEDQVALDEEAEADSIVEEELA